MQYYQRVDLWGRLSNPHYALEIAPDQGFLVEQAAGRRPRKSTKRPSIRPRTGNQNNRGQHSNPRSRALAAETDGVDSPATGGAARHPTRPVQRRLTQSDIAAAATGYHEGRSLTDLAREYGVHRRTVADHLERLGIVRRVNLAKLTTAAVRRAATRYRAGESLATVGRALNVDASTVQRALKRAGVPLRPRPGS